MGAKQAVYMRTQKEGKPEIVNQGSRSKSMENSQGVSSWLYIKLEGSCLYTKDELLKNQIVTTNNYPKGLILGWGRVKRLLSFFSFFSAISLIAHRMFILNLISNMAWHNRYCVTFYPEYYVSALTKQEQSWYLPTSLRELV